MFFLADDCSSTESSAVVRSAMSAVSFMFQGSPSQRPVHASAGESGQSQSKVAGPLLHQAALHLDTTAPVQQTGDSYAPPFHGVDTTPRGPSDPLHIVKDTRHRMPHSARSQTGTPCSARSHGGIYHSARGHKVHPQSVRGQAMPKVGQQQKSLDTMLTDFVEGCQEKVDMLLGTFQRLSCNTCKPAEQVIPVIIYQSDSERNAGIVHASQDLSTAWAMGGATDADGHFATPPASHRSPWDGSWWLQPMPADETPQRLKKASEFSAHVAKRPLPAGASDRPSASSRSGGRPPSPAAPRAPGGGSAATPWGAPARPLVEPTRAAAPPEGAALARAAPRAGPPTASGGGEGASFSTALAMEERADANEDGGAGSQVSMSATHPEGISEESAHGATPVEGDETGGVRQPQPIRDPEPTVGTRRRPGPRGDSKSVLGRPSSALTSSSAAAALEAASQHRRPPHGPKESKLVGSSSSSQAATSLRATVDSRSGTAVSPGGADGEGQLPGATEVAVPGSLATAGVAGAAGPSGMAAREPSSSPEQPRQRGGAKSVLAQPAAMSSSASAALGALGKPPAPARGRTGTDRRSAVPGTDGAQSLRSQQAGMPQRGRSEDGGGSRTRGGGAKAKSVVSGMNSSSSASALLGPMLQAQGQASRHH